MAERAAKQLELNKSELPNSITEVIATLSRAGFDAYIVGGGVRDTLLGLQPKDFDAVTDAKPHEIKDVFGKRCRIIGRRFQLAHVYSGRDLIEVATFRGPPTSDANTNQDGMILRDNVWGDIKQDFSRRDFSINALYYQPLKGVVHDFCGALEDINNKVIRLLGHAPVRIEEDPVRLLRALRFKAKLGFEFDKELSEQFHDNNWALLEQISPHRLYDETQKMFTGGYLVPLLPLLFESGAIDSLIIYPPSEPSALVKQVAINTDKRIAAGKSINPAFFYAALLWENYLHQLEKAKKRNMPFAEAQLHAASKVIDRQRIKTAIPKFAEQFIRDIWLLQPKLSAPRSKQIVSLSEHPRFRAGFDFLLLREQCGDADHPLSESTNGMGDWWQTYQTLSEKEQQQAIDDFDENLRRGAYKRGRGRSRQKPVTGTSDELVVSQSDSQSNAKRHQDNGSAAKDDSNVPSRRRRAESSSVTSKQSASSKQHENQRTQQTTQDSKELAQLQQLSLVSDAQQSSNKRQASQPEPLFVIEHEKVVPPLPRQPATAQQPKGSQTSAQDKSVPQKSVANKDLADNGKSGDKDQQTQQVKSASKTDGASQAPQNKANQSASRSSSPTRENATRSIARSPALVSINNEPIPHKRRRRLPSGDPVEAQKAGNKKQATTKYEKKAPKPALPSMQTDTQTKVPALKSAKSSQVNDSLAIASKLNDNKGPIPHKRRRRQPSVDNA